MGVETPEQRRIREEVKRALGRLSIEIEEEFKTDPDDQRKSYTIQLKLGGEVLSETYFTPQ